MSLDLISANQSIIGVIGDRLYADCDILYNFGFFSVEDLGARPDTDLEP